MPLPYYSIIIPTHGRPELLRRAIASLRSGSFKDFELLVISDEINKETFSVLAEVLTDKDTFVKRVGLKGPAASRNEGLKKARGAWVIFLDDDDAFSPEYLENAYSFCKQENNRVLYTNYSVIEEDRNNPSLENKRSEFSVADRSVTDVYVKNFIHNHTCLYPLNTIKDKLQDTHLDSLDDWDFLLNVMSDSDFQHINLQGPIIYKDYVNIGNRRGSSESAKGERALLDYIHIYRRWPAPTNDLKNKRIQLLESVGFKIPVAWV
jgi:glycosyltransferase involved in cell wall biosynthesis